MQYKKNKKIPKHQSKATEFSVITEQQMGKDSIQYLMNSPKRDKKNHMPASFCFPSGMTYV